MRDDHQLPPCNGVCPCPVNGESIITLAKAGTCPAGKFDAPTETASDSSPVKKKCGCGAQVAKGVVGLTKAALGIDKADDAEIERRQGICATCPNAKLLAGVVNRCALCGCAIRAKVRIKGEKCPAGKW
jgi:hypothetical protein